MRLIGLLTAALLLAGTTAAPAAAVPGERAAVGGGTGIVFGHGEPVTAERGAMCTLTAVGRDRAGRLVALTNAHCFYDNDGHQWLGDEVYVDRAPMPRSTGSSPAGDPDLELGPIGKVVYISGGNPIFPGPNGRGLDYAVILLDQAKVRPTATVGEVTIERIGPPPGPGTVVCKQGRSSGLTCGLKLFDVTPYFTHTIWAIPGDSGSPVTVGRTLIGNLWIAGGGTSMVEVVKDLAARGSIGAGFTPASS